MTDAEVPSGSVVVGVDGSPAAELALGWAADEAARRGVGLHVLHVFPWLARARSWEFEPPREALEAGERMVDDAAERARATRDGLTVTTQFLVLDPAVALVDASARGAVTVVGARGLGETGRLLGSVSQKVAAHAHGPVVVVRGRPSQPDGPVVVGMDPRDGAPEAVEYAFEEARRRGAGLTVIQGLQHEAARRTHGAEMQRRLAEVISRAEHQTRARLDHWRARYPDVPVELEQVREHPVEALVAAAAHACLVVVGSRGHSGLVSMLLGSVSRGVLLGAPVVAVVRVRHRREGGPGAGAGS